MHDAVDETAVVETKLTEKTPDSNENEQGYDSS